MYDPAGLEDVHAEWIEIQNQSQRALNLDDCVITDAAHLEQRAKQADLNGIWVEPMDYLLVMRSADRLLNGDLQPDSLFAFGLGNGGDHILVLCAGELIDEMDFDSGGNYPAAKGRSVQLYDDEWCPAESFIMPSVSNGERRERQMHLIQQQIRLNAGITTSAVAGVASTTSVSN